METSEYEALLTRLRDASIFLLKADALAFAGLVALIGSLKLERAEILASGARWGWVLDLVVGLIAAMLFFHATITISDRTKPATENLLYARMFRVFYVFLTMCHVAAMAWTLGYLEGYLGRYAEFLK